MCLLQRLLSLRTRPRGYSLIPARVVRVVVGDYDLYALGEIARRQGSDIRDGELIAGDKLALGQIAVQVSHAVAGAAHAALGQFGNLGIAAWSHHRMIAKALGGITK